MHSRSCVWSARSFPSPPEVASAMSEYRTREKGAHSSRRLSGQRSSRSRMPRRPREIQPGTAYHLISRFVDREWFIRCENERQLYLRLLGRAVQKSDWRLLSFGVMSNHIHLGAVAGRHSLDSWIRAVHSPFADAMNKAYGRIGTMFVRGPKAY